MAKGQHLSSYQQKVVHRYYEHKDSLTVTKLQETVSDLYLSAGDPAAAKAAVRKWKWIDGALRGLGVEAAVVQGIVAGRDVEGLARLVGEFAIRKS